jgi:hypothetical protein
VLHLIGVNHAAQAQKQGTEATDEQHQFMHCLRLAIEQVRPALIAEEDSAEALADRQRFSLAKAIADGGSIEHRFCDPTKEQRRVLGYKTAEILQVELFMYDRNNLSAEERRLRAFAILIARYFPIRERFWLTQLGDCRDLAVIFICGDVHIETSVFKSLLAHNHIPFTILERGIGVTDNDEPYYAAIDYLKEHPDLLDQYPN